MTTLLNERGAVLGGVNSGSEHALDPRAVGKNLGPDRTGPEWIGSDRTGPDRQNSDWINNKIPANRHMKSVGHQLRLLPTFASVLREKVRTRVSFNKILTNYTSEERLINVDSVLCKGQLDKADDTLLGFY